MSDPPFDPESFDSDDDFSVELDGFPRSVTPEGRQGRGPLEIVADEFLQEVRQGNRPSIEEFAARYKLLADGIRDLFPTLLALERCKSQREAATLRQHVPHVFPFTHLGRHRLLGEVARGGMGVVFEAIDERSGNRVAVKLLPWKIGVVPRWRERFEREVQTVSRLRHPNIVPVLEFAEQDGYCFYVMPFVDGVSLDRVIERLRDSSGKVFADEIRRPLSADQQEVVREIVAAADEWSDNDSSAEWLLENARRSPGVRHGKSQERRFLRTDSWNAFARIVMKAAEAVVEAHAKGVLHNDIKPGNILLETTGRVRVTDFGLAASVDDSLNDPASGLTGTLRYMSPERFSGEADQRSDVYSLGVTLYELVTQQPLFEARTPQRLIRRILEDQPIPVTKRSPEVPRRLARIIEDAIARDPARRTPSVAELVTQLRRYLAASGRRKSLWGRLFGRR